MAITAAMVKELRELTGAGMMDCKKALGETDGDMDAAVEVLKKSGMAKVEKKASRIAAEGITRVASNGNTGILVYFFQNVNSFLLLVLTKMFNNKVNYSERKIIKNNFFENNVHMKINKVNTNIKMCLHHALCF